MQQLLEHATRTFPPPDDKILALVGHSKGAVVALALASSPLFATLESPLPRPSPSSFLPVLPHSNSSTPAGTPRSLTPPPSAVFVGPRRPFVVSLSGRYDTSSLSPSGLSRFTPSQISLLESQGSFVWLTYRVGASRSEKREYVVTKEEIEGAKTRTLECVDKIPEGCAVLCLHGRADGTVPPDESRKIDERIAKGKATGDLVLVEGVEHNWDKAGELEMAAGMITAWFRGRAALPALRPDKVVDHLGLERKR